MRHIHITKLQPELSIQNVTKELKFIADIGRQYAKTNEEAEILYVAGVKEFEELKASQSEGFFQKNVVWAVRQRIMEKAQERR